MNERICSLFGFVRRTSRRPKVYRRASQSHIAVELNGNTYAGQPMTMATAPKMESPLPYPRALYIVGANSGKPNPAQDRRNVTAAKAEG